MNVFRTRKRVLALAVALAMPIIAHADGAPAARGGKQVVDEICVKCHGTGEMGAPKIGDKKAWRKRAAKGLSGLTTSALKGVRKMPPHGGRMDLTDFEMKRAITHMVNQSGGKWREPVDPARRADRSGKEIVAARCSQCHETGKGGAPRIGDKSDWIPRMKNGMDEVVRSAINGHGGMPARGGLADLNDREMRAAVNYMWNPASAAKK